MSDDKRKANSIDNIKELRQLYKSEELENTSKSVKALKRSVEQLVNNAKVKQANIRTEKANLENTTAQAPQEKPVEVVAKAVEKKETEKVAKVAVEPKAKPTETAVAETVVKEKKEKTEKPTKAVKEEVKETIKPKKEVAKEEAKVETKVETPTNEVKETPAQAPAQDDKAAALAAARAAAIERAAAKALAIENRIKKYYSENGREGQNNGGNNGQGGQRPYNNNKGQGGQQRPYTPRLDKDGKPIPRNNNWNNNGQGGQRPYNNNGQGGQRPYNNNGGYNRNNAGGGFDKDKDAAPMQRGGVKKPVSKPTMAGIAPTGPAKQFGNKNKTKTTDSDKKGMNKRTLIRKGFIVEGDGYEEMGNKKLRPRKSKPSDQPQVIAAPIKIEHAVVTTDIIPIKKLSEKIGISATEITKKLFQEGIMKTVNESIDFQTAEYIAMMYEITLEYKPVETAEEAMFKEETSDDDEAMMVKRPPVVTVMGHVDHGKTSLLDAIKNSRVTVGEAGGITQHIGAYTAEIHGEKITFIDTPGHEAFTSMRKRGAQITDIAILVVAADDGVMPQTIEAINHIKAAGVELMVAINKMDKPTADVNRIMQQLTEYEVLSEEWGGSTIMVPVSAKTKQGIDDLLESILLVAEVLDLKANPDRKAKGVVIEAKLDKTRGPVATVLVQNGTLKVGDTIISGFATGKIRAMTDDKGRRMTSALPSQAVSILGLGEVPQAGEKLMAVDDKLSKAVLEERVKKAREALVQTQSSVSLEDVFKKFSEGKLQSLNLIVKADVQGSVEAVKQSLLKLSNDEVAVKIIHSGAGAINESDVMLASTSEAIIIGFNVRPDAKTKSYAEKEGVEIKTYSIIYQAIEDIQKALKGMLAPEFKEVTLGSIEVRSVFKITGAGTIAGGYVIEGKPQRNSKVRLVRDGIVVHEGEMSSLKRFKDDVKEVAQGYECGVGLANFNDMKVGDIIECSIMEEIKRD